ncbi:MAG: cupin, partial [Gemmatimonadetes bacterium]
ILHIIEGECDLTLGEDAKTAQSGAWVHMQPNLPHSIKAKKPLIMLLILIKSGKS